MSAELGPAVIALVCLLAADVRLGRAPAAGRGDGGIAAAGSGRAAPAQAASAKPW